MHGWLTNWSMRLAMKKMWPRWGQIWNSRSKVIFSKGCPINQRIPKINQFANYSSLKFLLLPPRRNLTLVVKNYKLNKKINFAFENWIKGISVFLTWCIFYFYWFSLSQLPRTFSMVLLCHGFNVQNIFGFQNDFEFYRILLILDKSK